jgi:CheY-like chemotaxis protein
MVAPAPSSTEPSPAEQRSLLIVEDERALRRLLEYRLGGKYEVRTAAHGQEALDLISQHPPDLIVSDIMMPHMDGFALQEALREDKNTRAIPFIFLTAKDDDDSRLKGLREGVDDYITKPFDTEQLMGRVDRLMERTEVFRTRLSAELGRDFSERLMPRSLPEPPGWRTFFVSRPHDQGGGDLFAWKEPEPSVFFLTVGDVMGKGLQAKFYAYTFLSYIRGTIHAMLAETRSPATLMSRINEMLLSDEVVEETFASLLMARWDANEGTVTYANAGHSRPLLLSGTEESHVVEDSDLVLGLEEGAAFHDYTLSLGTGEALVLYTDGLTEQPLESGRMIGEQGVLQIADSARAAGDPPSKILGAIEPNTRHGGFDDDILMFWLQREADS